jgi:hypothetical protein
VTECIHQVHGAFNRRAPEKADHQHRRLLRPRIERPCYRRAADERDELAPFHCPNVRRPAALVSDDVARRIPITHASSYFEPIGRRVFLCFAFSHGLGECGQVKLAVIE